MITPTTYDLRHEAQRIIDAIEPRAGATMTLICALREAWEAGRNGLEPVVDFDPKPSSQAGETPRAEETPLKIDMSGVFDDWQKQVQEQAAEITALRQQVKDLQDELSVARAAAERWESAAHYWQSRTGEKA